MNKTVISLLAILAMLVMISCSESKESYVNDFSKFVEKVQKDCKSYTEADWQKADETYKDYIGPKYDKFSKELNTDELLTITKLKAQYITLHGSTYLKNSLDKAIQEGTKTMDAIIKDK